MIYSLVLMAVFSFATFAQSGRRLNIQSKYDQFELVISGGSGSVNGKPADLSSFKDLIPVLTNPMSEECTAPKGSADVTVRDGANTRYIFIKQGLVSDGKNCLPVGGEGILYFPVHREMLIGPKHVSIPLKSPVKLFRQGVKLAELKKNGSTWSAANSSVMVNYDFIERFENSMRDISVKFRVQTEMGKDKTKMIVQSGDQSYEFYKLSGALWAVKRPGTHWLEATEDLSYWYDFDQSVLEDRFAPQIKAIDESKDPAQKEDMVSKLEGNWSPNIRDLYHRLVLDHSATSGTKAIALRRLKGKPAKETAVVMAKFLSESSDEDLKKQAGQILKIYNPKGPLYNPSQPFEERRKAVEFWSQWASKQN